MWESDASTRDAPAAGDFDALRWTRVEVLGTVDPAAPPELAWLDTALQGSTRAVLWQAPHGLVAPLSYRRHAWLDAVCTAFAARGWPVRLRRSGGDIVPQGLGIFNLSLTWPVAGSPGAQADRVYAQLCGVLSRALAALHIDARPRAVTGSFCDGRFNLAVGPRKIAGTAQYWRRAGDRHAWRTRKKQSATLLPANSNFRLPRNSDTRSVNPPRRLRAASAGKRQLERQRALPSSERCQDARPDGRSPWKKSPIPSRRPGRAEDSQHEPPPAPLAPLGTPVPVT